MLYLDTLRPIYDFSKIISDIINQGQAQNNMHLFAQLSRHGQLHAAPKLIKLQAVT